MTYASSTSKPTSVGGSMRSIFITSCLIFALARLAHASSNNTSNTSFYEELGVERLQELAVKSGLSSGDDIKRISEVIKSAKVLLEIGGGYGRAADFISKNMSSDAILYLVENTPTFVHALESKFSFPILVMNKDFRDVSVSDLSYGKPDLILWMWSGLADFGYEEQCVTLKAVKNLAAEGGLVIIDLPSLTSETNATLLRDSSEGANGTIQLPNIPTTFQGFIPSYTRMQELSKNIGFILEKAEEYTTSANRKRIQFFLRN